MLSGLHNVRLERQFLFPFAQCINAHHIVYDCNLQLIALWCHLLLLGRSGVLVSSRRDGVSGRNLGLSLLVTAGNEAVQERARSASWVVISLSRVDIAMKVAGGLIVSVVVVIIVVILDCAMSTHHVFFSADGSS